MRNVQLKRRVSIAVEPGAVEMNEYCEMMKITLSSQSYGEMGVLTFMLAVFAERPSSMMRIESGEIEAKVLCAPSSGRI
jgi:hypothetical protein